MSEDTSEGFADQPRDNERVECAHGWHHTSGPPCLFCGIEERDTKIAKLEATLIKISAIRDSIVGAQGFNFSEHAFPLVAALEEAGLKGAGHKIASKNFGTLLDRIEAAEAVIEQIRKAADFSLASEDPHDWKKGCSFAKTIADVYKKL